ncbi:MAG TPA: aldehyde dehydrogenase family protein, partial [Gemmatimonadaceae bacterium]|nr:aldehyde dehydrogenase family protein [Gemmatimonadaceae bacterium]
MAIATINPATGERLCQYPALTDREIDDKLDVAHRAASSWRQTTIEERTGVIRRAGELLEQRSIEYGRLMTLEMGKPIRAAINEAAKCAATCHFFADHAEEFLADEAVDAANERSYVAFEP